MTTASVERITGTVARVTKARDGFTLVADPQRYYNLSKQRPGLQCPPEGAFVVLEVEGGKWVNSITMDRGSITPPEGGTLPDIAIVRGPDRQSSINRSVALKAAVDAMGAYTRYATFEDYCADITRMVEFFESILNG